MTLNFCRHFINVTDSCGLLAKNESVRHESETLLKDLFIAQYNIKPSTNTNIDVSLKFLKDLRVY